MLQFDTVHIREYETHHCMRCKYGGGCRKDKK